MRHTKNVPRCRVRLHQIVTEVLGTAGDFAFPIYDATCGFAGARFGVDA